MGGKGTNPKKDQKREHQGTPRDGQTNQHRGKGGTSVGSHKPGGDGPGTKKFQHEHDDNKTRK